MALEPWVEQALRELCKTGDLETAKARISIATAMSHTAGMVEALHDAADASLKGLPSPVSWWLKIRAAKTSAGLL